MGFLKEDSLFSFLYNLGRQIFPREAIVFLGSYLIFFIVIVFFFLVWKESNLKKRIFLLNFFILAEILSRGIFTELIRFFYNRPRPFSILGIETLISHSASHSFPSGHAAFAFTLALVVFLINKKRGWFFLAAALLISLSRIMAGIHWPSDILASLIISLVSFLMVYSLVLPLKKKIFSEKSLEVES